MSSSLFTDLYFPQTFDQFIGNSEIVEAAQKWASAWQSGKPQKPLLFFGQTGSGKTCLVHLLAKQFNWSIFEMNASDLRSKEQIEKVAGAAALNASFDKRLRLVLIDEVDGLQAADRGGAAAIISLLKSSAQPIILTANDIYSDRKLLPLRSTCQILEFRKINYLSIAKRLREICQLENINADEEALKELAKNSSGDFRSALLDLQLFSFDKKLDKKDLEVLGGRERTEKIFSTLEKIFKGRSFDEIRKARFAADIDSDMLLRWIEENIPRIFTQGDDTANAFERLSRADVFSGRIMRRQHFGFLRYSSELSTAGVSLSRKHDYHGWLKFQFPTLLSKLSASMSHRAIRKSLAQKLAPHLHSSTRDILSKDLPYLQILCQHNQDFAIHLAAQFDLDENELSILLQAKSDSKKVSSIHEASQQLREKTVRPKKPLSLEGLERAKESVPQKPTIEAGQQKLF